MFGGAGFQFDHVYPEIRNRLQNLVQSTWEVRCDKHEGCFVVPGLMARVRPDDQESGRISGNILNSGRHNLQFVHICRFPAGNGRGFRFFRNLECGIARTAAFSEFCFRQIFLQPSLTLGKCMGMGIYLPDILQSSFLG